MSKCHCLHFSILIRVICFIILISITKRVQEHGGETIIPFSCALEKMLVDMPEDEAAKYCQQNNIQR